MLSFESLGWALCLGDFAIVECRKYVDGVAWHGYAGQDNAMTRVHEAHPEKHMYWTDQLRWPRHR